MGISGELCSFGSYLFGLTFEDQGNFSEGKPVTHFQKYGEIAHT